MSAVCGLLPKAKSVWFSQETADFEGKDFGKTPFFCFKRPGNISYFHLKLLLAVHSRGCLASKGNLRGVTV